MTLREQFVAKLQQEFNALKERLKSYPGELIVDRAYELVAKEGIISCFEHREQGTDNQLISLMDRDTPLNDLYMDCLQTDLHYEYVLMESLDYTLVQLPPLQLPGQPIFGHNNEGYEISQAILFDDNTGFVVGESETASHPYVTWRMFNDQGTLAYDTGRYFDDEAAAHYDYKNRATEYSKDRQLTEIRLPVAVPFHKRPPVHKEHPRMAEVLREAQAKADRINAKNALNKATTPTPNKTNPQIGD